jgi:hypothetical protein
MSKTEQIQERFYEPSEPIRTADKKRCYQCNGRFGLIRHTFALKQFCSKQCVDKYKTGTERKISRVKEWVDYFSRKP